jgi:hypothetical protein
VSESAPYFIMNRVGQIKLKADSKNQCKAIGHRDFQYQLRMVFDGTMKLDSRQYILDHQDVDTMIQKIGFIGSCEQIHQVLMLKLVAFMAKKKIPMRAARCVLKPIINTGHVSRPIWSVDTSVKAWLEYVHIEYGSAFLSQLLMGF